MHEILPLYPTLAVLAASVTGAAWFAWLERRPREFGRVRLVPTTPMMFLCALIAILMIVHLGTFLGVKPRRPL